VGGRREGRETGHEGPRLTAFPSGCGTSKTAGTCERAAESLNSLLVQMDTAGFRDEQG